MKAIKLSDIVTIGDFKNHAASWLDRVRKSGRPVVITQNGKPAGVVLSPEEFEQIQYKDAFFASIDQGIAELDEGKGIETKEVERRFKTLGESKKAKTE